MTSKELMGEYNFQRESCELEPGVTFIEWLIDRYEKREKEIRQAIDNVTRDHISGLSGRKVAEKIKQKLFKEENNE